MITVQLVYAHTATELWQQSLRVEEGCSIANVLAKSDLHQKYPSLHIDALGVAVFGRKVSINYVLKHQDRIELCRPLRFDPMVSRKRRAAHRNAGILKRKHLKPDRARKIDVDIHQ